MNSTIQNSSISFVDTTVHSSSNFIIHTTVQNAKISTKVAGNLDFAIVEQVLSDEDCRILLIVFEVILLPLTLAVGIPTNVLSCFVFYRQGLKDRMNLCLFSLALVDIGVLSSYFSVLSIGAVVKFWDEETGSEISAKVNIYWSAVALGFGTSSACYSAVIALERCICVVWPLHAATLIRTRTTGVILLVIFLVSQALFVFYPYKFTPAKEIHPSSGKTVWVIVNSEAYQENPTVFEIIDDMIASTIIPITTCATVTVCTTITVIRLKTALAWRVSISNTTQVGSSQSAPAKRERIAKRQPEHSQKRETESASKNSSNGNQSDSESTCRNSNNGKQSSGDHGSQSKLAELALTRQLVLLSCVYIACSLPFLLLALIRGLTTAMMDPRLSNLMVALHTVATEFQCINSGVNFFVYFTRSSRFKRILREICCGKQQPIKSHITSSTGQTSRASQSSAVH